MKGQKYIRILCEGKKSEPTYFRGMIKEYRIKGAQAVKPKDHSPLGIIKAAKEEIKKAKRAKIPAEDIEVWAVFDKDQHANLENAIEMARNIGVNVAFSNVCFEFWILLHHEKGTKPFSNCDEIISHIRKNYDSDYLKSDEHYYEKLKDKIDDAVKNNKWLLDTHWKFEIQDGTKITDLNPYTDVFRLVVLLKSMK